MENDRAFMVIELRTVSLEVEGLRGFDEGTGFDFGFKLMEIVLPPLIGRFLLLQREKAFLIHDPSFVYLLFLTVEF